MDLNLYALDAIARTRLAERRADAARQVLLASLRPPRRSLWAALRCALQRTGSRTSGREIASPRHA